MDLRLSVGISSYRLKYAPVVGRRTLYAHVTIGSYTIWIQRWSTSAIVKGKAGERIVWGGPLMTWHIGYRAPVVATVAQAA